MITVRIHLADGSTIERVCVSVSVAVAEHPWPLAHCWEVVQPAPEPAGSFW